ncbi:hypothetical protein Tco_0469615 [Tanacetum coccineum]
MLKEVGTPRYLSLVVPLKKVSDKTVHKELGDRMERATTTTSSLEAESEMVPGAQDTILGVDLKLAKQCLRGGYLCQYTSMDGKTCNIKSMLKSKRGRDTKILQSSGPPIKVGNEAVYKELGDRMERAATTASGLEAEQDSGNINRTQSMATLNGSSP